MKMFEKKYAAKKRILEHILIIGKFNGWEKNKRKI